MDARILLFYLVAVGGFVMVVGGMFLIWKEKIYIDSESKHPIKVEVPGGWSFTSNYPALMLFVLGFIPLIYPLWSINSMARFVDVDTVHVKGLVEADAYPAVVYAVRPGHPLQQKGEFRLPVSFLGKKELDEYQVLLIVNGRVLAETRAEYTVRGKDIEVSFRPVVVEPANFQPGRISAIPEAYK